MQKLSYIKLLLEFLNFKRKNYFVLIVNRLLVLNLFQLSIGDFIFSQFALRSFKLFVLKCVYNNFEHRAGCPNLEHATNLTSSFFLAKIMFYLVHLKPQKNICFNKYSVPKVRMHPVQSSDIYLSYQNPSFCMGKIIFHSMPIAAKKCIVGNPKIANLGHNSSFLPPNYLFQKTLHILQKPIFPKISPYSPVSVNLYKYLYNCYTNTEHKLYTFYSADAL